MKKSKSNKSHKYISKEKTASGSWKYIYKTIKTGLTRTQAERDKLAEEEGRKKPTSQENGKKQNSTLKTAISIVTSKRKPSQAKTDYVNKYVKTGKDYVGEWYKKANDSLHNFTVRSASANKCRKKASSLRDLLTQEV